MKPILILSLFVMCGFLRAEEELPTYLLVAPEEMEDVLVERVKGWMETNLYYRVRVRRLPAWEGDTGKEQLRELELKLEDRGIATVVMSDRLEDGKHAVVVPEKRMGVMNVPMLVPEVNETTLRRLDRQAIRIVGFSLGVPPQPVPFDAMYSYRDLEELDRIGRGFSPPGMARYRRQLKEHGIPLSPGAEQFLPKLNSPPPPAED